MADMAPMTVVATEVPDMADAKKKKKTKKKKRMIAMDK